MSNGTDYGYKLYFAALSEISFAMDWRKDSGARISALSPNWNTQLRNTGLSETSARTSNPSSAYRALRRCRTGQYGVNEAVVKPECSGNQLASEHTKEALGMLSQIKVLFVRLVRLFIADLDIAHAIYPVMGEVLIFGGVGDEIIFIVIPAQRYRCIAINIAVFSVYTLLGGIVVKIFKANFTALVDGGMDGIDVVINTLFTGFGDRLQ